MQFRTRKAAFIAMMLSDHAGRVFPGANQIFHRDGTLTVKNIRINLQRSGRVVVIDSPLNRAQKRVVKVSQPDVKIPTCADSFAAAGNEWGNPKFEFSAQQYLTKHQPDGTLVSIDHDTVQGYDDHGPVPLPPRIADQPVDQARVRAGEEMRRRIGARISARVAHGLR